MALEKQNNGKRKSATGLMRDVRESFRDRELRALLLFGGVVIGVGVVFYMWAEGWDFWQALYFSVTTLTTVGFGDLVPGTDVSRLFTTFYVLIGVGIILGMVNVVARQAIKPLVVRSSQKDSEYNTKD